MENKNLDPKLDLVDQAEDQENKYAEEKAEAAIEETEAEVEGTEAEVEGDEEKSDDKNCPCRKRAILSSVYDIIEIFALSIIAVIIIFSFCIRLCRVDGHSMQTTLDDGERIIAHDLFYTPKQGDIVVFHLVNDTFKRPLIKRVIATEGQEVEINFTDMTIYVDGVLYDDEYAYYDGGCYIIKIDFDTRYMSNEDGDTVYRAVVPEGKIFVLGDNRNNSTDSRSVTVGFVDEDCVLGKAILRLKPFTIFD